MTMVVAAFQAISAIQQGRAAKAQYNLQAKQAELQGRQNALNYSRQAVNVLQDQRRIAGSIIAGGAAGGVNPFTGSALNISQASAFKAGEEYNIGLENADMAIASGIAKSQSLKAAGKQAMKNAMFSAFTSIAGGIASGMQTGMPGGGGGMGGSFLDPSSTGAASGYGMGSVGYGVGYGINPFGQQAQMLSNQVGFGGL